MFILFLVLYLTYRKHNFFSLFQPFTITLNYLTSFILDYLHLQVWAEHYWSLGSWWTGVSCFKLLYLLFLLMLFLDKLLLETWSYSLFKSIHVQVVSCCRYWVTVLSEHLPDLVDKVWTMKHKNFIYKVICSCSLIEEAFKIHQHVQISWCC